MTYPENFNLLDVLLKGTSLIEASAGTGKTYAIVGLFLRLIIEKRFPVNEIVAVTFTEAATEELRGRIRVKLQEAVEAFSGNPVEDSFLNDLAEKNRDHEATLIILREALHSFDLSAIFTIHGFCRKMLHENAFESGVLFDTELIADLGKTGLWQSTFTNDHYTILTRIDLDLSNKHR